MPKEESRFSLNGVNFTVETNQGFDNSMAQVKISAEISGEKKTVEIFDVKPIGGKIHISPVIKKVAKLPLPKDSEPGEIELDDDIISN